MTDFKRLPINSERLLAQILNAENPSEMLCKKFDGISSKEDSELSGILRELRELGYLDIKQADNAPCFVIIKNHTQTYSL